MTAAKKLKFQVKSQGQKEKLSDGNNVRKEFHKKLKDVVSQSCFIELMEERRKSCKQKEQLIVPNLFELAAELNLIYNGKKTLVWRCFPTIFS